MQPYADAGRTRCGRLISEVGHEELVRACEALQTRVESLEARCAMIEHKAVTSEIVVHETRRSVEKVAEATANVS